VVVTLLTKKEDCVHRVKIAKIPLLLVTRGGVGTPYNGLYGEAPPERGYHFQVSSILKGRDFTS